MALEIFALAAALSVIAVIAVLVIARRKAARVRAVLDRVKPGAAARWATSARLVAADRRGVLGVYDDELLFVAGDEVTRVPLTTIVDTSATSSALAEGPRHHRLPAQLRVQWTDGPERKAMTWEVFEARRLLAVLDAAR